MLAHAAHSVRLWLTGASGLLGRHLLADPRARSVELLAPTSRELDLRDGAAVLDFARQARPDRVVHAAARSAGIQARTARPLAFLADNVLIAANVITAATASGVEHLLNLASAAMYPATSSTTTLRPDQLMTGPPAAGNASYGLAKLVSWQLAAAAGAEGRRAYRTIVPCNIYGPFDDFDPARSQLVPSIVRKVVAAVRDDHDAVEFWGDGTAARELLYAGDLADFIWTWLDRLEELPGIMNVGSGQVVSIRDCYALVGRLAGFTGTFRSDPTRPTGSTGSHLDIDAQRSLGWSPRTSLHDGLAATIDFYRATEPERPSAANRLSP